MPKNKRQPNTEGLYTITEILNISAKELLVDNK